MDKHSSPPPGTRARNRRAISASRTRPLGAPESIRRQCDIRGSLGLGPQGRRAGCRHIQRCCKYPVNRRLYLPRGAARGTRPARVVAGRAHRAKQEDLLYPSASQKRYDGGSSIPTVGCDYRDRKMGAASGWVGKSNMHVRPHGRFVGVDPRHAGLRQVAGRHLQPEQSNHAGLAVDALGGGRALGVFGYRARPARGGLRPEYARRAHGRSDRRPAALSCQVLSRIRGLLGKPA